MARAPGGHAPIVGFLDEAQRNTCDLGLLFQRLGLGEPRMPATGVGRGTPLHTPIRLKPHVGLWILPTHRAKLGNFPLSLQRFLARKATIVLVWPELSCLRHPSTKSSV